MNFQTLRQSRQFKLFLFFGILTLLISPWRNANSQDDAAWSYTVISMLNGGDRQGGGLAMNLLQLLLGFSSVKLLPFLPPIALLNFLTWLFYLGSVYLLAVYTRLHWMVIAAFFVFPIWVQYGAIYHGEIYSGFLLIALMGFLANAEGLTSPWLKFGGATILSFLVSTQLQNMAAFPFCWGAFLFLRPPQRKLGISLIVGSVLSVVLFALIPKTHFQQSYSYWLTQNWLNQGVGAPLTFVANLFEMFTATGLYLLPFIQAQARSRKDWLGGIAIYALTVVCLFNTATTMSGGVFFLEYFPKTVAVAAISLGIWGWWGIARVFPQIFRDVRTLPAWGTIVAFAICSVFSTYRYAIDIRYMMTWTLPFIFHLRQPLSAMKTLGQYLVYLVPVTAISLVFNVYLLNTTDVRWETAAIYEAQGVPRDQIGAGYGWNLFFIATDCMNRALVKIEKQTDEKPFWKSRLYYNRFLNLYGRTYEDEWIPKIVIKPSMFLGRKMDLNKYRLPGQESEPVRLVDYTTLGIPSQLAVFENKNPVPAWCFR